MKATTKRASAALLTLIVLGCEGRSSPQTSSSSHWVVCASVAECAGVPRAVSCVEGYCVDGNGQRVSEPASTTGGSSAQPATGGASSGTGGSSAEPATGGVSTGAGGSSAQPATGGALSGGNSSVSAGEGGESAEGGASGASTAGSSGVSTGGRPNNCDCVIDAYIPVCGVDGKTYDVACGEECVSVELACRGQCPCPGVCGTSVGVDYPRPNLAKACTRSEDCIVLSHLRDCCGSREQLSFHRTESGRFNTYEAGCPAALCDCPGRPLVAEDGTPVTAAGAIAACVDGRCIGRSAESDGTCLASNECIDLDQSGACIPAPGTLGIACRGEAGLCKECP